ncbi:MAG: methylase [Streptococcaceae bacterium]|jgi:hypothetical protein|nr:methylase [Streptococcaceae bacterium]
MTKEVKRILKGKKLTEPSEKLIKSKLRVQKHGEVFTPSWMVEKMLNVPGIKECTENIDATFLEPAMGDGNFVEAILLKKLSTLKATDHSWDTYALRALSSLYGIELLEDNLEEARTRILSRMNLEYDKIFQKPCSKQSNYYKSSKLIIQTNLRQGNTLQRCNKYGEEIVFSQWRRVKGTRAKVERIPFSYSSLFEENVPETVDLFDNEGQINLFEDEIGQAKKYKVCDIDQVWKEEME